MFSEEGSLWTLFVSAFLSSTILPGGSEVVLATLLIQESSQPWKLLAVATIGNTLGGMSTWCLGRFAGWWYPPSLFTQNRYQKALHWLQRWGSPILLLSWVPVIGDPLCLVGGWLRIHWVTALIFIALGKTLRYAAIVDVVG